MTEYNFGRIVTSKIDNRQCVSKEAIHIGGVLLSAESAKK